MGVHNRSDASADVCSPSWPDPVNVKGLKTAFGDEANLYYFDPTGVLDGSNAVHGILPSTIRRCYEGLRSVLVL